MAETKSTPRVIRRGQSASDDTRAQRELEQDSETFSAELTNGRVVTLRELTAGDLLYLEKSVGNAGETERALKLAVRLSVGEGRITYEDVQKMKMRDMKIITDLLSKAGDVGDDDEDEFPNE